MPGGVSRDPLIARRTRQKQRLAALLQHQAARDPETGKSRIAVAGGRVGGARRAEQIGDGRALGLALNLHRWHGVEMPPVERVADT